VKLVAYFPDNIWFYKRYYCKIFYYIFYDCYFSDML